MSTSTHVLNVFLHFSSWSLFDTDAAALRRHTRLDIFGKLRFLQATVWNSFQFYWISYGRLYAGLSRRDTSAASVKSRCHRISKLTGSAALVPPPRSAHAWGRAVASLWWHHYDGDLGATGSWSLLSVAFPYHSLLFQLINKSCRICFLFFPLRFPVIFVIRFV